MRVVDRVAARLGESPMWVPGRDGAADALWYVDIPGRALHRWEPGTGARARYDLHAEPGSAAPMDDGRFLLALRDGLWTFDPAHAGCGTADPALDRVAAPPFDPATTRYNDGKCDAAGRFWVGSVLDARTPDATLHAWDGRMLVEQARGITTSNGLAWSPDGRTMYWADSAGHVIYAFDVDPARGLADRPLGERRVFARFAPRVPGEPLDRYGGRPDGAAVDVEGCYWVAMFDGARLLRLSPAGEVLAEVPFPARRPTMPCFGGRDLKTLYVTSARDGQPPEDDARYPDAGCVFAFEVDAPGLPTQAFRPAP